MSGSTPLQNSAATEPLIQLDRVGKIYDGGTKALQDVNLTVFTNEFLCLLGSSGCGKTTLLRLLAQLEKPTSGTMTRRGELNKPYNTGYVFQQPTLLPWLNIFENVYLPFRIRGISRNAARAKINMMLERLGLAPFSFALPNDVSLGMAMRASLARALITEPKLLLMDEPFAALDEMNRQQLNDDLLSLWQQSSTTIVFVTHSVLESAYLASRIAVLSPRPGTISQMVAMPRDPQQKRSRTSKAYFESVQRISEAVAHNAETVPQ